MFSVIYQTVHGDTISSDNPKQDALKQMAYLRLCGHNSGMLVNADGSITVQAETITQTKIANITFKKE